MIKEPAGYNKGKRAKNLNYYYHFKTALCCRFEPLVSFVFWILIPGILQFSLYLNACLKVKQQSCNNRRRNGSGEKCLGASLF